MTEPRPLALVTGASSGIGFELARQFAEHGFDLLVNAEDPTIDTAAAKLRSSGTAVSGFQADLRTAAGVDARAKRRRATGSDTSSYVRIDRMQATSCWNSVP